MTSELMPSKTESNLPAGKKIYVTRTGLPLSFHVQWPFRKSTSGADFWFVHADIRLENSDGLHAPMAVNLSSTLREVLPSLEPRDAEGPVIDALRKEVDKRQVEFVRSGKLIPVQFSSRHYDFKRGRWVFGGGSEQDLALLLSRKVYWQTRLAGGPAWVGDPTDALYVESTSDQLMAASRKLEQEGLLRLEGEQAIATPRLMERAAVFEAASQAELAELEKKHAFERG